jgi:hypothetical protein
MNLVKFRKDLDFKEFTALAEKDESTIYFIRESNKVFLGPIRYGSSVYDVGESESIVLTFDEDAVLTAVVKISQEPGNAIELKADGLYAPPGSVTKIDSPEDGDLVMATLGDVDDARIAIIEELTAESNNWEVPSLAAVLSAISKVAPIWNSETVDDNIFPQNELPDDPATVQMEIHDWLDYMDLVVEEDTAPLLRERSFL